MLKIFPLISCICVTRNKPAMLNRAIKNFIDQSYTCKELVVLFEDDDSTTVKFVENYNGSKDDIRFVKIPSFPKRTLGELRNIGIDSAKGEYICQWDDDDWYNRKRLLIQYESIVNSGKAGSAMARWIIFNCLTKKAYISNRRVWEGSILCRKSTIQQRPYELKIQGEDTATIEYLVQKDYLQLIEDNPWLYIYCYHGGNTWNAAHWDYIFQCGLELTESDSLKINSLISGDYIGFEALNIIEGFQNKYNTAELSFVNPTQDT